MNIISGGDAAEIHRQALRRQARSEHAAELAVATDAERKRLLEKLDRDVEKKLASRRLLDLFWGPDGIN